MNLSERIEYWKKIPYEQWDKDEVLEISFVLNKLQVEYQGRVDEFISELIEKHRIVLTEAEKLKYENLRLKYTLEQFTTRKN